MLIPLVAASERGVCQKLRQVWNLDFIPLTSVDDLFERFRPVQGIDALRVVGRNVVVYRHETGLQVE